MEPLRCAGGWSGEWFCATFQSPPQGSSTSDPWGEGGPLANSESWSPWGLRWRRCMRTSSCPPGGGICTPAEQDAEDWKSGNTGLRPKTWWNYEVFYFAPNEADVAEGAELLRQGLQRLRMAGDWGVSAAASVTAGPGATSSGLGQMPEGSPATEGFPPQGTAPAHGITHGPWRHFTPTARSR